LAQQKINIAIDGYSSCGKGTLAKYLAKELGYIFIDSGAMYRAVTLAMKRRNLPIEESKQLFGLLNTIFIGFEYNRDRKLIITLDGEDEEDAIRSMDISNMVSPVSKLPMVRDYLVYIQQEMGRDKGLVMDGRDIGTVVFPDAELKIFMTANPDIRAKRRFEEMQQKGVSATYEEVFANLKDRDERDSTRELSPLKQAKGAFLLDNSNLTREEQNKIALAWAMERIEGSIKSL
jgi:cytidylate kinase